MADTLGILVTTDKHLDSVVELVNAAHAKGKEVQAFFTGAAVHLTLEPDFARLAGKAKLWICRGQGQALDLRRQLPRQRPARARGRCARGRLQELRHPGPERRDARRVRPLRRFLTPRFSR
jgi:hypothetical protein